MIRSFLPFCDRPDPVELTEESPRDPGLAYALAFFCSLLDKTSSASDLQA